VSALPVPPPQDAAVTLARIDLKVDQLLEKAGDHETRLRSLEERRVPRQTVNVWVSAAAAIAAVCTVVEGLFIR
jgi:hypothetical protein